MEQPTVTLILDVLSTSICRIIFSCQSKITTPHSPGISNEGVPVLSQLWSIWRRK